MFLKVMGINSMGCELLKAVGLLVVLLDLAKLQLKNHNKKTVFVLKLDSQFFAIRKPLDLDIL